MKRDEIKHKAILNGDKTYFTGEPCKNRHIVDRYVSNGNCINCIKEGRSRAYKLRNERNKLKKIEDPNYRVNESKAFYEANREYILYRAKIYRDKNKDKKKASAIKWKGSFGEKTGQWRRQGIVFDSESQKLVWYNLITSPDAVCQACLSQPSNDNPLCLDHDHKLGHPRAILCKRCNIIEGYLDKMPKEQRDNCINYFTGSITVEVMS